MAPLSSLGLYSSSHCKSKQEVNLDDKNMVKGGLLDYTTITDDLVKAAFTLQPLLHSRDLSVLQIMRI